MLFEGESEYVDLQTVAMDADVESDLIKETRESRKLMRELKTILSVKESPAGLMSFPLTKSLLPEEELTRDEFSCGEEIPVKEPLDLKRRCNSAYVYDPNADDTEEVDTERFALPSMQPMCLPAWSSGGFNMTEEAFGSSDDNDFD